MITERPNRGRPKCVRATTLPCEGEDAIRIPVLVILASSVLLASLDLPESGPLPEPRPKAIAEDKADRPANDAARPETADDATGNDKAPKAEPEKKPAGAYVPPPVEREDPTEFAACLTQLKSLGADFSETKPIDDGGGCGIERPLTVRSLGGGVKLAPEGTMRCRAAVNLARWTQDVVTPMLAKSQPKETLAEVNQASTYICRKRNNADTGKISEHARGNAVDIAGFTFKSGKTFTIAPREEDSTLNGAFQRSIASAACLYFSTVLDPGSDAAHETHLHLDVLKRKRGYRYCW